MHRKTSNRAPSRSASASAAAEPPTVDAGAEAPVGDDEIDALLTPLRGYRLAILAVSGGADSTALMHLAARWQQLRQPGVRLLVASVDHGLRAGSADEAAAVAAAAEGMGLAAQVLTWAGAKPATGIQDAARLARYRLLAALAAQHAAEGPVAVVTAHTRDDQAETLLMRLARGSGVTGLAAMPGARRLGPSDIALLRPLLGVSGARLRATLRAAGRTWIEDPSNALDRFERVRVRKARAELAALGLSSESLALSARRLRRADDALEAAADALERAAGLDLHGGAFASLGLAQWHAAPEEMRLRLIGRLLASFGGQPEPVRLSRLEALAERMSQAGFKAATLAGAVIRRRDGSIEVFRETQRAPLPQLRLAPGGSAVWDRRFLLRAGTACRSAVEVGALGARGYATLRRQLDLSAALPAAAAASLPAFWHGEELLFVPYFSGGGGLPSAWSAAARLYSAEFIG